MKFDKIVLAIPHSVRKKDFSNWDRPYVAKADSDRWTDWFTDRLFTPFYKRNKIVAIVGSVPRFDCDLERLANDPLESVGRGILYNTSHSGARRLDSGEELLHHWHDYRKAIVDELTPNSLLIDCHSFPREVSDVEICIGVNEDWSTPDEETMKTVLGHFDEVAINDPFSGSLTPEAGFPYKSLMIEVNKKLYLDESGQSMAEFPFSYKVHNSICKLYEKLLDLP